VTAPDGKGESPVATGTDTTRATKSTRTGHAKLGDGVVAQRAEHADLERRLTAAGGAGSDKGQTILEAAAEEAAERRISRRRAASPAAASRVEAPE
jgi:hypothetical protein